MRRSASTLFVPRSANTRQRPEVISAFSRFDGVKLGHTFQRGLLESRGATELTKVGTHHQGDLSQCLLGRDSKPGVANSLLALLEIRDIIRLRNSYCIGSLVEIFELCELWKLLVCLPECILVCIVPHAAARPFVANGTVAVVRTSLCAMVTTRKMSTRNNLARKVFKNVPCGHADITTASFPTRMNFIVLLLESRHHVGKGIGVREENCGAAKGIEGQMEC